jgi:hypothetical protein
MRAIKLILSRDGVAGNNAIGHETRESFKSPSNTHVGQGDLLKCNGFKPDRGVSVPGRPQLFWQPTLFYCFPNREPKFNAFENAAPKAVLSKMHHVGILDRRRSSISFFREDNAAAS